MIDAQEVQKSLAQVFGFHAFRPHQEEIVRALLARRDVFAVMPTGGGKSLCYQLPAHLLAGVCVVVSPLISLMKDQVDAALANGLRAASLNSTTSGEERRATGAALRQGALDLLYVSPERFNAPGFCDWLKEIPLAFFAIDEAHCISAWGHDFRPDYLALSRIATEFPGVPLAAFTATATARVAEDIAVRLGLRAPYLVRASFDRPNLFYQVTPKEDLDRQLLEFLRERGNESGIIYRTTRKNVEATAKMLTAHGVPARAYHAGLPDEERAAVQDAFRRDECPVIVATIAFGMGIDKSNVRFVIHADLPKNIEGYYQETGRAGRDGEPARCALFFNRQDVAQLARFAATIEDAQAREIADAQLRQMLRFAQEDGCRRAALLRYFGEELVEGGCSGCDVCAGEVEREDATVAAQKALSAVARTGGHFGAGHIVDILIGANTERIRQHQHDQLPTYGVGKDHEKSYWRCVMDALLSQGMTSVEDAQYPVPALTEEGWKVLRGQQKFQMLKQARSSGRKRQGASAAARDEPYSEGLFALLREERMRLARAANVPPYVVFSDRTLHEMARYFPQTSEQLLAINGVGVRKLETYGEPFLRLVRNYAAEHAQEASVLPKPPALSTPAMPTVAPPTVRAPQESASALSATESATLQLLKEGKTLEEMAQARALKAETIVNHIEKMVAAGHEIPAAQYFTEQRLEQIAALFAADRSWLLKPVVEADGTISYAEARLARVLLQQRQNQS